MIDTRLILFGAAVLLLFGGYAAKAMTGACYLDRAPGGCFERESKREQDDDQRKQQYQSYRLLIEQTPATAVPSYCLIPPGPNEAFPKPIPEDEIASQDVQRCIESANAWQDQERQRKQKEVDAFARTARWQKIESDTGAVFKIDVAHIAHFNVGSAEILVYSDEGGPYNPENLTRLLFDCRGHYQDESSFGATLYAAPRSVVGKIGAIACARPVSTHSGG